MRKPLKITQILIFPKSGAEQAPRLERIEEDVLLLLSIGYADKYVYFADKKIIACVW